MSLNLDPLKAAVDDIVKAAESVGEDVVNQEAGVAQSDIDDLTNALQGAHAKLGSTATAETPVAEVPAAAPAASETPAPEGSGSAGGGAWTPPSAEPAAGS